MVIVSQPPNPATCPTDGSSPTRDLGSNQLSRSIDGGTREAGTGPKTVTSASVSPSSGRATRRCLSKRTATLTAGAPGANDSAFDLAWNRIARPSYYPFVRSSIAFKTRGRIGSFIDRVAARACSSASTACMR